MAYLKVNQKNNGNIRIADNEIDIDIYATQKGKPQKITVEKECLQELINQLENCL